jgi:hypothetical protein
MKDRYSYKLGIAIPNPNSGGACNQFELSADLSFSSTSLHPAIYRLNNTIQLVDEFNLVCRE